MKKLLSRKMGVLEKIATVFHDKFKGATSVSTLVKCKNSIAFELFTQSWNILFHRHPMLRATCRQKGNDYFFDFNADFNNISIKEMKVRDFADIEQEYSRTINRFFDVRYSVWRVTLIEFNSINYIVFGATHAVSDGKCTSALLAELFSIYEALERGEKPHMSSQEIPFPFDEVIDKQRFIDSQEEPKPYRKITFEKKTTLETAQQFDVFKTLHPEKLMQLLNRCRQNEVTISSALNAALVLAMKYVGHAEHKADVSLAINLRPYTKNNLSNDVFCFCAHQIFYSVDLFGDDNFWSLAKQSKKGYEKAIREYQLLDVDNYQFFDEFTCEAESDLSKQQFFVPHTISNVGVIDAALADYIDEYYFSAANSATFSMLIFAATVNNTLCLDFNYCCPALSHETASELIDQVMRQLHLAAD